jgi:hypothetical protein
MSIIFQRSDHTPNEFSLRRVQPKSLLLHRWPLRDEPRAAAGFAIITTLFVVLTLVATQSTVAACVVAMVLALAAWRTVLPVSYLIDSGGIEQHVLFLRRRVAWAAVARCEIWPDGVRLLRSASGHPLDALRSMFIPWQADRDAILGQLTTRALRARLFDGSGRVIMPSTVNQPGNSPPSLPPSSITSTSPLTIVSAPASDITATVAGGIPPPPSSNH